MTIFAGVTTVTIGVAGWVCPSETINLLKGVQEGTNQLEVENIIGQLKAVNEQKQAIIDQQNNEIQELEECMHELRQNWWQKLLNQFSPNDSPEIADDSHIEDEPEWVHDLKNLPETPSHSLSLALKTKI